MVSQKGGKVTNGGVVGNAYSTMQKIALQKSEQKEFIKKICTISTFFKLVNFAKVAIFS